MEISESHECFFTFEFIKIHVSVIHVIHIEITSVCLWKGVLLRDVSSNRARFAFNKAAVV